MIQKSNEINEIATALVAVQAAIQPAIKDSKNPFFKSSYADLASVWDACAELLASHGLSVVQLGEPAPAPDVMALTTMLMHTSGQWIAGTMESPLSKQDAQAVGSCTTYLRRYGLAAMIGIRTEDDDGAAASGTVNKANITRGR
jgi:hypothetical protein